MGTGVGERLLALGGCLAALAPGPAIAGHIDTSGPGPALFLAVGTSGPGGTPSPVVDLVTFDVTTSQIGSGIPAPGSQPILIAVAFKAGGPQRPTITLRVSQVSPLVCSTPATCGTTVISYSDIGWTTGGGMPAGNFGGMPKDIFSYVTGANDFREDTFSFFYANTSVYPGGIYGTPGGSSGRVVFTAFTQ